MLFRPDMIEKILAGEKTQTRRVWEKARVKVGNTYAIKKQYYQKNADAPGFYLVLGLKQENLGAILSRPEDIKAEGFDSGEHFIETWTELHGEPDWNALVWVIDFELADGGSQ